MKKNEDKNYSVGGGIYKVLSKPILQKTEKCKIINFTIQGGNPNDTQHKEYKVIITANNTTGTKYDIENIVNDCSILLKGKEGEEQFTSFYLKLLEALEKENKDDAEVFAMKIFCLLTKLDIKTFKENNTNTQSQSYQLNEITNKSQPPCQSTDLKPTSWWQKFFCCCCKNDEVNFDEQNTITIQKDH